MLNDLIKSIKNLYLCLDTAIAHTNLFKLYFSINIDLLIDIMHVSYRHYSSAHTGMMQLCKIAFLVANNFHQKPILIRIAHIKSNILKILQLFSLNLHNWLSILSRHCRRWQVILQLITVTTAECHTQPVCGHYVHIQQGT